MAFMQIKQYLTRLLNGFIATSLVLIVSPILPEIQDGFSVSAEMLQGYAPKTYKDGKQYGNGVYFAPHDLTIYEAASGSSKIIEQFHWDRQNAEMFGLTSKLTNRQIPLHDVFLSFYPKADIAMMAVIGESAGLLPDGAENTDLNEPTSWVEVVYDQSQNKSGWVKLDDVDKEHIATAHMGLYQSWLDFMKYNAKSVGIYWLSGVSQYQRGLRQKDSDDSPLIDTIMIRDMKVKHVRGNWLLVEVLDFAHNTPIGWIRWRDDSGNLMAFPNLTMQKGPAVITGFKGF